MADEEGPACRRPSCSWTTSWWITSAGLEDFRRSAAFRGSIADEDTWIDAEARGRLEREVAELAARARQREGSEPPEWVGLEGTGDIRIGEELGWKGLLEVLQKLAHLLHLARAMGMEVWALPND